MLINKLDNVEVDVTSGHKYAITDIKKGENIIKYGMPIGHATEDIKKGDHVHTHNVKTNLSGKMEYAYEPVKYPTEKIDTDLTFMGYVRENGDISREDLLEKAPFDSYDISSLFGENISSVLKIISILHESVNVAA